MFDLDALARADARLASLGAVAVMPAAPKPPHPADRAGDPSRCPHLAALAARELEEAAG